MINKSTYGKPAFYHITKLLSAGIFFFCLGCVEPVFENREGLIYIDGLLSTNEGLSSVGVFESVQESDKLEFQFVSGADVKYRNIDNGNEVVLLEQERSYEPPDGFIASSGSSWELDVRLSDGRVYRSSVERIGNPVPISDINFVYNPELVFRENTESFLPGHRISVDVNDPVDEENYYLWEFRSFENLEVCNSCGDGVLRDGECIDNPYERREPNEAVFDYLCDRECWQIRFNENINLFSDEFSNGRMLNNLPAGNVLLYTKENIVVEVQQFSLSAQAFKYYEVLNDIVDNNGGLNAPPPAALIGNMFNPDDSEEFVLGRFTAAASSTASVFIDRRDIMERPIDPKRNRVFEVCEFVCPSETCFAGNMGPPCLTVTTTICSENRFRTASEPEGWLELD